LLVKHNFKTLEVTLMPFNPKIASRAYRRRYRQIVAILIKHGFGFLIMQLGLGWLLPFHKGIMGHAAKDEAYTKPEHLRMALEELGTTFIKLGQIMSTRVDLLPPEYLAELSKLQASVQPISSDIIQEELATELGAPVEELFAEFEDSPLAAASIGQVHRAKLPTGERVVVKIQRPGVQDLVNTDLDILHHLAGLAARRTKFGELFDLQGLLDEFAITLRNELNYIQEARNGQRFKENFQNYPKVYVPEVFWNYTTKRVITLEEVGGIKIDQVEELTARGIDRHELAVHSAQVVLKMVFEDGLFHADPHPGNFFVGADGTINLIDFGMVGTLDEDTKEEMVRLFLSVIRKDQEGLMDSLLAMGVAQKRVDRDLLKKDVHSFLNRYYGLPLGEIHLGHVTSEVLNLAFRHKLRLPANLSVLAKTILMSEGLGRRLDPDFNFMEIVAPFGQRLIKEQYSPGRIWRRISGSAFDLGKLLSVLPNHLLQLFRQAQQGSLVMGLEMRGMDQALGQMHKMVNRLSISMLTTAFILGMSLMMASYQPKGWERLIGGVISLMFLAASFLGIWLIFSIWRSGRR